MTPHKLTADMAERHLAMRYANALQDLVSEPPDALTIFEEPAKDGRPAHWRIEAYFTDEPDGAALAAEVAELLGVEVPPLIAADVPDLNWVALSQAALPPVIAGRFTVHGSHDLGRVPQGPNAILIDAGEAFGTAHHATTYGCLLSLSRLGHRHRFSRILDLGCGSGVLAIAADRLWPKARIQGVDIDAQSVVVARENARANGSGGRVSFVTGAGFAAPSIRLRQPFDLIVANILAGPLIVLAPEMRRASEAGGTVLLSGILNREAASVIAAYRAQGFAVLSHMKNDGWSAITLRNRAHHF